MIRKQGRCDPVAEIPEPTDWDRLFDGGVYLCESGIDFDCPLSVFVGIVRWKADKAGVKIQLESTEDGKGFVVQRI
jgi:hypothetical protein